MKIIVVGSLRDEIYAPAFVAGFQKIGNKVCCIDTSSYIYKCDWAGNVFNRLQAKFHFGLPLLRLNKDIVKKVKTFQPDFVFFYSCFSVFESTYRIIHNLGIMYFTYCNDDPFSSFLNKPWCQKFHKSLPLADWNFVYRPKNIRDYKKHGLDKVSILLPYYLENSNFPINCRRDIPLGYIGHWEGDGRDDFFNILIQQQIPIKIFGPDIIWKCSSLYQTLRSGNYLLPAQYGKDYNNTLNRFQVAIVFLSKLNNDTYTRRCFEIPATKTCMLCEYTDDMNRLFPENECAVYFRNIEDFVEKAKYLVSKPEECKRIGENAYNRLVIIGGSEVDRCKEVIDKCVSLLH